MIQKGDLVIALNNERYRITNRNAICYVRYIDYDTNTMNVDVIEHFKDNNNIGLSYDVAISDFYKYNPVQDIERVYKTLNKMIGKKFDCEKLILYCKRNNFNYYNHKVRYFNNEYCVIFDIEINLYGIVTNIRCYKASISDYLALRIHDKGEFMTYKGYEEYV